MTDADRTRAIKAVLRRKFPDSEFSVTRGGERIAWTDDGPAVGEVQDVLLKAGWVQERGAWNGERCLEVDRELEYIGMDDKWIGRIWATFAAPKRSGRWLREHKSNLPLAGLACAASSSSPAPRAATSATCCSRRGGRKTAPGGSGRCMRTTATPPGPTRDGRSGKG